MAEERFIINPEQRIGKDRICTNKLGKQCEVRLSTVMKGTQGAHVAIYFFNKVEKYISKTEYIKVQPVRNRLYFMEAGINDGYKISRKSSKSSKRVLLGRNKLNIDKEEGCYNLEFDNYNKLYYIDYLNKKEF